MIASSTGITEMGFLSSVSPRRLQVAERDRGCRRDTPPFGIANLTEVFRPAAS